MRRDVLRALQAPLEARYREEPEPANLVLRARARAGGDRLPHRIRPFGRARRGLHPATGGDGTPACSGDMLREAPVACAGVTLPAVATSLGIDVRRGIVSAEGDLDFRGTLGVARDAPVGFASIRLAFALDSDASDDELSKLVELTERYCVVYQTLRTGPHVTATRGGAAREGLRDALAAYVKPHVLVVRSAPGTWPQTSTSRARQVTVPNRPEFPERMGQSFRNPQMWYLSKRDARMGGRLGCLGRAIPDSGLVRSDGRDDRNGSGNGRVFERDRPVLRSAVRMPGKLRIDMARRLPEPP